MTLIRPRRDDGAALISAMLFMVLVAGLSLVLLAVMVGQAAPALTAQKRTETGYAAQAGLQAALNAIRSIEKTTPQGDVIGDRTKLPCTLSGRVDGSTDRLTYVVEVQYFDDDPTYQNDGWRASHKKVCTAGGGVATQPFYALILSRGSGAGITPTDGGNRGIAAVYAFRISNVNIPGGLFMTNDTGAGHFCLRASGASVGARISFVAEASCTVEETDFWVYSTSVQLVLASTIGSSAFPTGLCIERFSGAADRGPNWSTSLQPCRSDASRWNQLWSVGDAAYMYNQHDNILAGYRGDMCLQYGQNNIGGLELTAGARSSCGGWSPSAKVGAGAASYATHQVVNFKEFGRCMDVTNHDVGWEYMIVYPCKQDPTGTGDYVNWNHKFYYTEPADLSGAAAPQEIYVHSDRVSPSKHCLETPDPDGDSALLVMRTCDGSAKQQWTRVADSGAYASSWVFMDAYRRCIGTMPTPAHADQVLFGWVSAMGIAACTGQLDQKWNAPSHTSNATVGGFKEIAG